jgi:hypothetical protein
MQLRAMDLRLYRLRNVDRHLSVEESVERKNRLSRRYNDKDDLAWSKQGVYRETL